MEAIELFQRFGLALASGLLIGVERGWHERGGGEGTRTAGVRTFALIGLLGGLMAVLGRAAGGIGGGIAFGLAFAVFAAIFAAYRWNELRHVGQFGVTTVVAAMVAFALGAYALVGDMAMTAALAVAATAILAFKERLHGLLRRIAWVELRGAVVLLAMTFVALPVLPDRTVDPWGALNPYDIWLVTIMISAFSFVGYLAIRLAGERTGLMLAGAAGGLVASTAATVSFARHARGDSARAPLFAGAAVVAGGVMALRVLVVVGVLNAALVPRLAPALLLAAAVMTAFALVRFRPGAAAADDGGKEHGLEVENPFQFSVALQFGALLSLVLLLTKWLQQWLGDPGVLGLAALSGMADVDAITVSMARGAQGGDFAPATAVLAILIVVAVNTITKAGLGWLLGGRAVGLFMAAAGTAALAAAALGWWLGMAGAGVLS